MSDISRQSLLLSSLNTKGTGSLIKDELYKYTSVFLSKVVQDDTNSRFFPSKIISDVHAYQLITKRLTKKAIIELYDGKDKVLIGKSCIVNCFKYGSLQWKKANQSIESILELAENVAVSEIIQVPTIYPIEDNCFRILTGHRRFFAMIFNDGIEGAAHFKVYDSMPLLLKTKQFQENASREELPQYGKLNAFQGAKEEVEILSNARQRLGQNRLTIKEIANLLGISMGAYDNYNVLTRYPAVVNAFENGYTEPFVAVKKFVLKTEKSYKAKHGISKLIRPDFKEINRLLESYFQRGQIPKLSIQNSKQERQAVYTFEKITSPVALKTLLTKNVCEIDCGVDWNSVDWDNSEELNGTLKQLVEHLNNINPEEYT